MKTIRLSATAALLALGPAGEAHAQVCGQQYPLDPSISGDLYYSAFGTCEPWFFDHFWDAYDFDEVNWNEGFGHDNTCNVNLPLARTMNAIYALTYSSPTPDYHSSDGYQGDILEWGGLYAPKKIDELDGSCEGPPGVIASTWNEPIIDNLTELYLPFFYSNNVAQRAATIIHEARHASGSDHDAYCGGATKQCDSSWDYNGAYRYDVAWAAQFVERGVGAPAHLKARLTDDANNELAGFFAVDPGFRLMHSDVPLLADFNGDGRDELVAWRPDNCAWFAIDALALEARVDSVVWGLAGHDDRSLTGDFNDDGKDDLIIWRRWERKFYMLSVNGPQWGELKVDVDADVALVGDFDNDDRDDFALWNRTTGAWWGRTVTGSTLFEFKHWGEPADRPLIGDFNKDGKDDLAMWRPSTGEWFGITTGGASLFHILHWGELGDMPMVGDFDGDDKDDLAVWRPLTGEWFAMTVEGAPIVTGQHWGVVGDIPLVGKIDQGKAEDMVVWNPSEGTWWALNKQGAVLIGGVEFGQPY
ncbi:MAG TPA: VCBS repeat-containing protein [Polyangiaceae bacterium]|nr:VCBS repeat-containing protein [Polyangiaceae bacterium]